MKIKREPETFEEAFQNPKWIKAMEEEIIAQQLDKTWDLVKKLRYAKPISCKWIYKIECHTNGSFERHKARLVDQVISQEYGLDYDETFNQVDKLTIVLVLLALATSKDWNL